MKRKYDTLENITIGRRIGVKTDDSMVIQLNCYGEENANTVHKILNDNNIKHFFKKYRQYSLKVSIGSLYPDKIKKYAESFKKYGIKSYITEEDNYRIEVSNINDIKKLAKYCSNPEIIERMEARKFKAS